jgi:hypothetical protein
MFREKITKASMWSLKCIYAEMPTRSWCLESLAEIRGRSNLAMAAL